MITKNFLPTFLIIIILSSCEGMVGGDGKVLSSRTKEPIEKVQVNLYLNDRFHRTSISTKDGSFRGSAFVGCFPNCPTAKLILIKEGYKRDTIDFGEYWKVNDYKNWNSLIFFMTPLN